MKDKSEFHNKRVTVMGLGLFGGGVGLVKYLLSKGANVLITDLRAEKDLAESLEKIDTSRIKLRLGEHKEEDFRNTDYVFINPAVPPQSSFIKIARDAGVKIEAEINLFFKLCPCTIIGITGTNGKSTTTALIGEFIKASDRKAWVGGNIGNPLLPYVDEMKDSDLAVLELSSFQLETLSEIKKSPHISIITNITPNHLDRHKTMDAYINAKMSILNFQDKDDFAILNMDDEITSKLKPNGTAIYFSMKKLISNGAFVHGDYICFNRSGTTSHVCKTTDTRLRGTHNIENILAAVCAAKLTSVPDNAVRDALKTFKGLEHRLEYVDTINGIEFYNDSIATTPESSICGINSFSQPIVLICGGYDKKIDLSSMIKACEYKVKAAIIIGATTPIFKKGFEGLACPPLIHTETNFKQAVKKAFEAAKPGYVVLLSPGCASYDMFRNFMERGNMFKEFVKELK